MMDKRLRSEFAQSILIISVAEHLHFDNPITRFIKFGSMCSLGCPGGLISC